jgi:cell wall assembly regulator SMI1
MTQKQTMSDVWARFITLLAADAPQMVERIRPPATAGALAEAEQRLAVALPEDMRQLYLLADGFAEGAFLLRDDYRILPLSEMIEASLALVGETVVLDYLAGEVEKPKKVTRLLFARAQEDDPDVSQVSVRLRAKKPSVELWYLEGGIHDWEEVVELGESVTEWIDGCLQYYG